MWRIEHGELDGYKANVVTLMIGTNNNTFKDTDPANVAAAIEKIVGMIRERQPEATVVLHAILPRGDSPESEIRRTIRSGASSSRAGGRCTGGSSARSAKARPSNGG